MDETLEASKAGAGDARPLSPWLVWWAAVSAALFVAWVLLPAAYLLRLLAHPGPATFVSRARPLWLQYLGIPTGSEFLVDPFGAGATVLGLIAGLAALALVAVLVARRLNGEALPGPAWGPDVPYAVLQGGLAVAILAVVALSLTAPVPARPLGWWFVDLAAAAATAWLARRRRAMAPAAAVLATSGALAIAIDAVAPPGQALAVSGGALEALAFAGALVASVAAVPWVLRARPWVSEGEPERSGAGRGVLLAALLAVLAGLAVVAVSASGLYSSPAWAFGDVHGRDVVVLSPHMDDESAFAGETDRMARAARRPRDRRVHDGFARGAGAGQGPVLHRAADAGHGLRVRRARRVSVRGARTGQGRQPDERDHEGRTMERGVSAARARAAGHDPHLRERDRTQRPPRDVRCRPGASRAMRVCPLYVAWGYDTRHDTIAMPQSGRPIVVDGGPDALARKAAAVDGYIAFYEDYYSVHASAGPAVRSRRSRHAERSRARRDGAAGRPRDERAVAGVMAEVRR